MDYKKIEISSPSSSVLFRLPPGLTVQPLARFSLGRKEYFIYMKGQIVPVQYWFYPLSVHPTDLFFCFTPKHIGIKGTKTFHDTWASSQGYAGREPCKPSTWKSPDRWVSEVRSTILPLRLSCYVPLVPGLINLQCWMKEWWNPPLSKTSLCPKVVADLGTLCREGQRGSSVGSASSHESPRKLSTIGYVIKDETIIFLKGSALGIMGTPTLLPGSLHFACWERNQLEILVTFYHR